MRDRPVLFWYARPRSAPLFFQSRWPVLQPVLRAVLLRVRFRDVDLVGVGGGGE